MKRDKIISMQEMAKTYYENIGNVSALLKIMEECGELVRALAKFVALSEQEASADKMQEAFNHAISESVDVYITLMWLFGSLNREAIQQDIGMRLVEVLNKLELTRKLALDERIIQVEHGLPIGVRIENIGVPDVGLKVVQ